MKRVFTVGLFVLLVLAVAVPASAAPDAKDDVKLRVFVHYPKGGDEARPVTVCDPTEPVVSAVYATTGWEIGATQYRVNYGTIPSSVSNARAAINASFATWQTASGVNLTEGPTTTATRAARDSQNVVVWGNVPSGAIAVTYTWYNPSTREVVEVDTVMGRKLPWAYTASGTPDASCGPLNAYDVRDILTHEIGHWMGLSDLYTSAEHDLTMFGYGSMGELKKDTLGTGDLNGIQALYGK